MKNITRFLTLLIACVMLAGCEDNEIMPGVQKKGTATTTVATIVTSNAKPPKSTNITITLTYVNPASDQLKSVELKAKVGSGSYTTIQTFDTTSDAADAQVTKEITYMTPNSAGTVTFDMVISSQLPYPQIQRTTVSVQ